MGLPARPGSLLTSLIVTACLAYPASARAAGSCQCPGYPDLPVIAPLQDSPLPTNGRVLLRDAFYDAKVSANTPSAEDVPGHLEPAGGSYVWLVLDQELQPAKQYKLTTPKGQLTTFNAFEGPDTEPPGVANVQAQSSRVSGDCFDVEVVRLTVVGAGDDLGLALTVKVEIDAPNEESVLYFPDRDVSFISADQESECFTEAPGTEQGKSYSARVTIYDRAGNASEVKPVTLAFPKQPEDDSGCGCRVGDNPRGSPAAVLLALGWLALRRRRRHA